MSSTAFSGVRVSFLVQPFSDAFTAMTPFFLLINQCDGCCFFWLGGSWLEGAIYYFTSHGGITLSMDWLCQK